jgi:hypothetical protein
MIRMVKWLFFALVLVALWGTDARAQVINAASCNQSDVQTAFNSVTSSTTTVNIPSGTCHWTSHATLNVPSGSSSLTIMGASNCSGSGTPSSPISCNDATQIIDDDTSDSNYLVQLNTAGASSFLRFSGITIAGGSGGPQYNGIIAVNGFTQNLRIDHFHMNGTTFAKTNIFPVIRIALWCYGVVDHSLFEGPNASGVEVYMDNYGSSSYSYGDGSWADGPNFGSGDFIFVENNTFNLTNGGNGGTGYYYSDCVAGGRFVTRYNTFNDIGILAHPTTDIQGRIRGCRAQEIYNNTFQGSIPSFTMLYLQSGTALVWGNTVGSNFQHVFAFRNARGDNSEYAQTATPSGWGYCGTSFDGVGSGWDQNSSSVTGYACLDQVGRGKGNLLANYFPNVANSILGGISWPSQAVEPVYEWGNSFAGSGYTSIRPIDSQVIQPNREYYLWCNGSSSSGCSNFNGSSGTGSGTLSSRPSSCTAGVAYWATDQNTLYKCTSTNTWSSFYTPFTYPHPLVAGGGSAPSETPPAAPTNLSATVE